MPDFPDKYTNVKSLQPGKNAKVYRARHQYLNQDIFLKVYDIPKDDPIAALAEPHLLTSFDHENLVKIRYVDRIGEGGSQLLLGMDLADGGTFAELIDDQSETGQFLSIYEAIRLCLGCAQGLSHMHDKQVIHCDIKPANIVSHANTPKITDLGLSRQLGANGRAAGSKHAYIYRPPEVWQGLGYSVRSDIYQLGIVFYQLLGGVIDFTRLGAMDPDQLRDEIINGELINLETLGPHILKCIRDIILKATGPEELRYETMREFALALSSVRRRHPDYQLERTSSGFNVVCQRSDKKNRILVVHSNCRASWEVSIIDFYANGSQRVFRRAQSFKHVDLSKSRVFLELLRTAT